MWTPGSNIRRIVFIGIVGILIATAACSDDSIRPDLEPGADGPSSSPLPNPMSPPTDPQPGSGSSEQLQQTGRDLVGSQFPGCSGSGPVDFAVSPMRDEDILQLIPYGTLVGVHVTPIDHMYFEPFDSSLGRDAYEVRVIQDGVIHSLEPRDVNIGSGEARLREWRMEISHSCTFMSYFDLLTSLDPEIEAAWQKTQVDHTSPWVGIPVKAGQVIGRIGGQTLDFGVYDYEITLPGFITPALYEREPWKVHTVDPFPYFPDEIRTALLDKMLRQAEPRAGKIDHDVAGTLSGNWFQEGTNGYGGANPFSYWDGHLAIVPDALDPTQWRYSTGNFSGESGDARQFGIKGNTPNPRLVTAETGLVTYELVDWSYYNRDNGSLPEGGHEDVRPGDDIGAFNGDWVRGVALLQLNADGTLKSQVFPEKIASEVTGFTSAAKTYER